MVQKYNFILKTPRKIQEILSSLSFPHQLLTGKTSDNQRNNIVINTYVDNFSMRSEQVWKSLEHKKDIN